MSGLGGAILGAAGLGSLDGGDQLGGAGMEGSPDGGVAFSPDDIENLVGWYDPNDIATLTGFPDDVQVVADKSASGNDLTAEGTGAFAETSGSFNGNVTLDMADSDLGYSGTITETGITNIHAFLVLRPQWGGGGDEIWLGQTNAARTQGWRITNNDGLSTDMVSSVEITGDNFVLVDDETDNSGNITRMVEMKWDVNSVGTELEGFRNGISRGTDVHTPLGVLPTTLFLSGDGGTQVDNEEQIGEILIYNALLTAEELTAIRAYLLDKWIP